VAIGGGAEQGVVRWCAAAADVSVFSDGLLARLGAVVKFDGAFLAAVDPATLLYTRAFRRGMPPEASAAFLAAEFGDDDVNQLRQLVLLPSPVGWLDQATGGHRMAAGRYRRAMLPFGLGDELRVALVADGTCWGLLCLHRAQARAGFEAPDAARLAALAPYIAGALRRALLTEQVRAEPAGDGPGVALVDADGTVRSSTPAAARWLAELSELDQPRPQRLPTVVASVLERLTSAAGEDLGMARARVLAPSGQWLTVHASRLDDADGSVAIVVEPASPTALAPLIVAAYGLTARESQVTQRLLTGLARKTIASELRISQHTVNDHVKAVFDKTGVSSAGELRAQVFRHGTGGLVRSATAVRVVEERGPRQTTDRRAPEPDGH
jgi:DNA-binding CsgD family transcriptional regulator